MNKGGKGLEFILSSALIPEFFFDSFTKPEEQANQRDRSCRKQSPEDDKGPERKVFFLVEQDEKTGANRKVQDQGGSQSRNILFQPDRCKQMGEENIDKHDEGIAPKKVNPDTLFSPHQAEVGA